MKNIKNIKYVYLLAIALGFTACNDEEDFVDAPEPEVVLPVLTAGNATLSNYVALGASFTAGFIDGALFEASQENSFPNFLSQKFASIGGGAFTQPLMNDNTGGMTLGATPIIEYRLVFNGSGPQRLNDFLTGLGAPVPPITTDATANLGSTFNNCGVPGAKSFHMTFPGYGQANPYFGRFATSAGATMLDEATGQNPTFFTLSEVGGNDVLSYATSGGIGVDQTGNFDPTTYGNNDITDPTRFGQVFNGIVDQLIASNPTNAAQGVLANLPYITDLPFFTTVPHNPVPLDEATAMQLNTGYAAYNGGLQTVLGLGLITSDEVTERTILFSESETNALIIIDEDLTDLSGFGLPNFRQATADDLITLPTSAIIPLGAGTASPLGDVSVLTPEEQLNIKTATDKYNETIDETVERTGLAFVDFKDVLQRAATVGIENGDHILTTDLVTGGLVSLDGIHLTPRGYAVMANEFMRAIDKTYSSNFEASGSLLNVADYNTNFSPSLQ